MEPSQLYPIDKKIDLSSLFAFSKASFPQGNQSTGLKACCYKYGELSFSNLLGTSFVFMASPPYLNFTSILIILALRVQIMQSIIDLYFSKPCQKRII